MRGTLVGFSPTAPPHPSLDLVAPLARLAGRAGEEFTGEEMLRELCRVAGGAAGVDGAGVMQVDTEAVHFVHANTGLVEVERLQEELQRGPCIDSIVERKPVVVPDISAAQRWPEFASAARRAGLETMVAMPLLARGCGWGVLDLYRSSPGSWTAEELAAVRMLTDVAAAYVAMAADRDLARVARRELEHRATHDELTGLPNRALLFDRVEHATATAQRHRTAVAVLLVDVDRFKDINDTRGHAAGDAVLAEMARRLRSVLRENDTLARLSGDEFVVVCEDLAGTPSEIDRWLEGVVRRMHEVVRRPVRVGAGHVDVSVSIGAAVTSGRGGGRELVGEADRAMYLAKSRGRRSLVRRRSRPC